MAAHLLDGRTRRILVKNVSYKANTDKLMIYFQKKKHGGCGDVLGVTFRFPKSRCNLNQVVIEFESAETVQSILRQQPHDFLGTRLDVSEFPQQCFGKTDVTLSDASMNKLRAAGLDFEALAECSGVSVERRGDKMHLTGQWYQVAAAECMIGQLLQRPLSNAAAYSSITNGASSLGLNTRVTIPPTESGMGNNSRIQAAGKPEKTESSVAQYNRAEVTVDGNVFAYLSICHPDELKTFKKNFKVKFERAESLDVIILHQNTNSTDLKEVVVKFERIYGGFEKSVKKRELETSDIPYATDQEIAPAIMVTNKIHRNTFAGRASLRDPKSKIVFLAMSEVDAGNAMDTFRSMFPPDQNVEDARYRVPNSNVRISIIHGDFRKANTDAMLSEVEMKTGYGNVLVHLGDDKQKEVAEALQSVSHYPVDSPSAFACSRLFHCRQTVLKDKLASYFSRASKLPGLTSMTIPIFWPNHYPGQETGLNEYSRICASIILHSRSTGQATLKELHVLFGNLLQARNFSEVLESFPAVEKDDTNGSSQSESRSSEKNSEEKREDEVEACAICLEDLTGAVSMKTLPCTHTFHQACIDRAFSVSKKCPMCMRFYGKPEGNQPKNGTMVTRTNRQRLPGHSCDTIVITYYFPSGVQGPEHPNPGQRYQGTSRTAYLPNNEEGQTMVLLLRKAFEARLTFTVGRSVTTGVDNCVTWNDIHHKTNTHGGPSGFGYPDPLYLSRLRVELADKGITRDSQ